MTEFLVSRGFTSSGITLGSGDSVGILFEGTAISSIVGDGASEEVEAGGISIGTTVTSGGSEIDDGVSTADTIDNGGFEFITDGGIVASSTITSGGIEEVAFLGTAVDTVINKGGTDFFFDGGGKGTTVESGGTLVIIPGSNVVNTLVEPGGDVVSTGVMLIESGAPIALLGDVTSGALVGFTDDELVLDLGTASSLTLTSGGYANIYSGGTAIQMSVGSSGYAYISSGGTEIDTRVASGGIDDLGGYATGMVVSGGFTDVRGGVASGTTVLGGGVEQVEYGGTDIGTIISDGRQDIGPLATVSDTSVGAGGIQLLSASATTIATTIGRGGVELAAAGAIVSDTTVGDGGTLILIPGATAPGVVVMSGGAVVSTGVVIDQPGSGLTIDARVASDTALTSGGVEYVMSGGTAIGSVIKGSGLGRIYAGGTAASTTVELGGTEIVSAGGEAIATTIASGTLDLASGGLATGGISFTPDYTFSGGTLEIEGTTMPTTPISGLGGNNSIWLYNVGSEFSGSASLNSATDVLTVSEGGTAYDLQLAGDYAGAQFSILPDDLVVSSLHVVSDVPCFAAGTRVLTARGDIPVEQLVIGDLVRTDDGMLAPVVWIGSRQIECTRHPAPQAVWPVYIEAHAFANDQPRRCLHLSPDHAIFVAGVLIPVKYLINAVSIRQVPVSSIGYFHIELPSHAVILAEGLPVESYLDTGDRETFSTLEGPAPRFGSEARDIALIMDARGYAPLRVTGAEVDQTRALLARRAAVRQSETTFSALHAVAAAWRGGRQRGWDSLDLTRIGS